MRLVLDTNVLVSAILASGPPRRILERCVAGEHLLLQSPATIHELADVLQRPKLKLTEEEVQRVLAAVASIAEIVETTTRLDVVRDDPDDDRFLELAVDGNADSIVSGDRHLLKLTDFRGIPIVRPSDFGARSR